jgi:ribosome recycling factor
MDIVEQTKKKMNGVIEHLKTDLKSLRTGRANPGILDNVTVEVYGSHMRLRDLANVSAPEARSLLVTPFDPQTAHAIAKGIEAANLNVQPVVDGNNVRIKIPEMDAKVRGEMCKQAKKKCEEAKVGIRNVRREGNELAKKQKGDGLIPEDMQKKIEKNIQDHTDKFCKLADDLTAEKEKEIMQI